MNSSSGVIFTIASIDTQIGPFQSSILAVDLDSNVAQRNMGVAPIIVNVIPGKFFF